MGLQDIMFSYVYMMSLQEFENDVSEFNQRVEDLDRRLGTVFIQAFDDAPGLEHAFKVCKVGGATPMLYSPRPLPTVLFLQRGIVPVRAVLWASQGKGVCRTGLLKLTANAFLQTG